MKYNPALDCSAIKPGDVTKCPHCSEKLRFERASFVLKILGGNVIGSLDSSAGTCEIHGAKEIVKAIAAGCPSCGKPIVSISVSDGELFPAEKSWLAYPRSPLRPVPEEVRSEDRLLAEDYEEASLLVTLSPKASAALSRRCLQTILSKKGKADPKAFLNKQIEEVSKSLPEYVSKDLLDAIRHFGNFGAHPMFSAIGEIVNVELGEAEWALRILDDLFDFYYVKPAESERRRKALEEKLKAAGKTR